MTYFEITKERADELFDLTIRQLIMKTIGSSRQDFLDEILRLFNEKTITIEEALTVTFLSGQATEKNHR